MRRLLLLFAIFIALVSIGIPQLIAQGNRVSILNVIDSEPLSGQQIELDEAVSIYFDRRVDCGTAQAAFSVTPFVDGTLSCDEYSLTFTPSDEYARDTEYTFALASGVAAKDGSPIAEAYALTLQTIGYINVAETFPTAQGGTVPSDSDITVIFDRPVIPLLTSADMDLLPSPLTIEPSIAGEGEWINTSMYMFYPEADLMGGTTYTVTINAGLSAPDGAILTEPYTWSFATSPPEIISIDPSPGTGDLILDPEIQVRFSQAMDHASVEEAFFVRLDTLAQTADVTGTFEWSNDDQGFMFTPDTQLQIASIYLIGLEGEVSSASGSTDLRGTREWTYSTVPYPAITGTDPQDGAQGRNGGFTIYFVSPMNIDTLADKISIEPEPDVEPRFYYSDWSNSYSVSFGAQPSSTYTVTVAPGMEDIYGNPINTGLSVTFTTAARPPTLGMRTPGPVGFYNAYREPTQMFIYHRGVDYVDLELYRVPINEFVASLTDDEYYDPTDSYSPKSQNLQREWRINSNTPENLTRFELLNLGGVGTDLECEGAPASRLQVGDTAIVVSDPDPLRARSTPINGEIVDLLYRDYSLPIVGGPQCVDGVIWWQAELRDDNLAWVAEGIVDEYFLELSAAAEQTQVTVSDEDKGQLDPGVYLLRISSPKFNDPGYSARKHFLNVSTAVLTVKQTIDSMTIWATDVDSGKPIVGETITVFDENANNIGSALTDENGVARMDVPRAVDSYTRRVAILQTDDHFGVGYTGWSNGLEPYMFGIGYSYYPQAYRVYMYTDRPVYRTGQPAYFRGIVRSKDDVTYSAPPFSTVPVKVYDDRGEVIYEKDVELTPFGTFSDKIDIAEDAPLGNYRVSVELPSEQQYRYEGGSVSFLVAEYRLPEYQVTANPVVPEVVQGGTVAVEIEGSYFFGGKLSNANVTYNVVANPYYFRYDGDGYYDFADYNYDYGYDYYYSYGGFITEGTAQTDEVGKYIVEVPAELKDSTQSQSFTVEAGVADESGQSIYARSSVIVHQGLVYVGARAENYVSTANEESTINLIAVDWDSNPVANQSLTIEVVERRWSSTQEQDPNSGDTIWTSEVEEIPVTTGSVTTDSEGKANYIFTPPNGGTFKIIATTRDEMGNEIRTATTTWVSSTSYVSWRQANDNTIELVPDQTDYTVGDTAKILITSPFQGVTEALISVERGDVMSVEHVTMDSNSYIFELPITPEHAPNIFVSVFLIKAVDESNPIAAYRMGITRLMVDIEQKELHFDISADRERASPQETVEYTIKVTDYKGDPVVAEVGVGVTDLAALSLRGPNSGPLLEYFYSPESLSVQTSVSLVYNGDEVTAELAESKGGGGGIFDAGLLNLRGEFIDTPYWNGSVVTDESGVAKIDVRLPDNLTTWRLDARALTDGNDGVMRVGQDTFDLLSTRPLIIRPVTPRFFIVNDRVVLSAVVNNNTEQDLNARVSIENITGLTPAEGLELVQSVTIPENGRTRVSWEFTVQDVESVAPFFVVRSDDDEYNDASISPVGQDFDGTLPVYRYEVLETVGTAGSLREGGTRVEALLLPRRFDVSEGQLDIKIDKSLAGVTLDGLTYLRDTRYYYYHYCIEHVVSRFLPNIITYRALNELGLAKQELRDNLDSVVTDSIQRLYARQRSDGGWGWCSLYSSHPTTTAYTLLGLTEAKKQGYPVDETVIQRAQEYLGFQMITPGLNVEQWRLNRQAFLLYALAYSGKPDVARTVTLYESRERMNLDALSYLAQALYIINPDDSTRLDVLAQFMLNKAIVSATGIHFEESYHDYWNWSTNTRSTSLVLDTLIKIRPDSEILPNIVRYLVVQRTADRWETRQETAWAVMALTNWMIATSELTPNYAYNVTVNDESKFDGVAVPANALDRDELVISVQELIQNESNLIEFTRTEGEGALYYTAHFNVKLPVPEIEAFSRGIEISRIYFLVDDENETPITSAKVGDTVKVRLTITIPNSLHYVTIEDAFPAGAEAVDPNLRTSESIGTRPSAQRVNPRRNGWGWWWFNNIEFRDEKAVFQADYLPKGTYEYVYTIRPSVEGTFNVIPPIAQESYFPEVYGRGDGISFTITN